MNHYSKLGVVFFRLGGVAMVIYGVMGLAYNIVSQLFLSDSSAPMKWSGAYLMSSFISLITGILVYLFGKSLGQLVGLGLDQGNQTSH